MPPALIPPACAASEGAPPASPSLDAATILANSACNTEPWIFANSGLTSVTMRASSGCVASARIVSPLRMESAPISMLPVVHASVNMRTSDGLRVGVRALPVRRRSRLRVSSADNREVSTPKRS